MFATKNPTVNTNVTIQDNIGSRPVPDIPWLPPSPQTPQEWFGWYDDMLMYRLNIMLETTHGSGLSYEQVEANRDREADRCRKSRPYMIAVYGSIYEARPEEEALGSDEEPPGYMIPFIPYGFQIRVMFEWYDIRRTRGELGDAFFLKARTMGLSNTVGFLVAGDWACEPVFQARMASRTEDLVDATGDPDSIFWKIEQFLAALPDWLFGRLVPGFDWKRHRLRSPARFIHPKTKNVIKGESTQANMGRGGRASVIVYDEFAFMPNADAIWTAGRASTRHRIVITTPSVQEGMAAYNLWHGMGGYTQVRNIWIPHYEHPLHDDNWVREEMKRDTEEGFAREVMGDWMAGQGGWVYPETHGKQPGHFPFEPGEGPIYITMDDGYDDDFAIIWLQYIRRTGRLRVFQAYRNSHQITDFYGSLLRGVPEDQFGYAYGKTERRIMHRQLELPPATFTIDAHFDSVEQMTGSSPYERFAEKYGIVAHMSMDKTRREFLPRRNKTGQLLPITDFHDEDGAVEVLEALQRYRFKESREGQDQMSEYKKPMHGKDSHYVTAYEWLAISWDELNFSSGSNAFVYTSSPHNSV